MQEMWNKRYADQEYAYGTQVNDFLAQELTSIPIGKILFVCEGEGRNAVYAAKLNWEVYAFDLSVEGKRKAEDLAIKQGVSFHYQVADATEVSYPTKYFDVVVLIYAHFPDAVRTLVHQKTFTWLKPGGRIILEAFNPNQLKYNSGGPKEPSMLYNTTMLQQDFAEFEINKLTEETCVLNEGIYHQGEAAVIRLVATKR